MFPIILVAGGLGLISLGLLLTWRSDLISRIGYDRERLKSMRPAWSRFAEVPIQVPIVLIGVLWVAFGVLLLQ